MSLLGIDPGVIHCGWSILAQGVYVTSGTLIPKKHLTGVDRQLWFLSRVQDVLKEYQPAILAYEEFMWRTSDDGQERYVSGRPAMERFIGGIQALALFPPFPVLSPLLPAKWGQQLFGHVQHTKQQIAWAVNQRLGTSFKGDALDNHAADATGIALVAWDNLTLYQMPQAPVPRAACQDVPASDSHLLPLTAKTRSSRSLEVGRHCPR